MQMNIYVDQQADKTKRHSSVITGHIQLEKFVLGISPMNFQCAKSFLFLGLFKGDKFLKALGNRGVTSSKQILYQKNNGISMLGEKDPHARRKAIRA